MKIKTLEVAGIDIALRAMRNPMNSWGRSDSTFGIIGEKDLELSAKLTKAGSEHCKHLRMIQVWMEIDAPRYWWQEFDTYKHVEKVSCSTIHKLFETKLKMDDFENGGNNGYYLVDTIIEIGRMREEYQIADNERKKELLILAKDILPESFLQKRTVNTNYQQLLNIYKQRKSHKLPQWQMLCEEIERLPYFKELTNLKGECK